MSDIEVCACEESNAYHKALLAAHRWLSDLPPPRIPYHGEGKAAEAMAILEATLVIRDTIKSR